MKKILKKITQKIIDEAYLENKLITKGEKLAKEINKKKKKTPSKKEISSEALLNMLEDLEEEKKKAVKLAETLSEAFRIANMGAWEWDIVKNKVKWSDELYKIFKVKKGKKINFETYLDIVHPEDKNRVKKDIEKSLKTGSFSHDIKLVIGKNNIRYHHVEGKTYYKNKKPVLMRGISFDITKFKKIEKINGKKIKKKP
ncbi:PAS domain-containing protein [archaeon]|mgnify:CR=1|jgi:PAS domain-containing protein|nr:PAS domain-containing protein [archaeon]MBT3731365.1 PAS domain-containing protein [archaeon]MBT4670332.1 PAS domain-containing protein [archaeon]MBT5029650.1 PAS domain-containing protein [archaeon]MBT5287601.1 PAS domain-containing protein [archaeon]